MDTVLLKFQGQFVKFTEPDDAGFNDIYGASGGSKGDFASTTITRPSRLNDDSSDSGGTGVLDVPF